MHDHTSAITHPTANNQTTRDGSERDMATSYPNASSQVAHGHLPTKAVQAAATFVGPHFHSDVHVAAIAMFKAHERYVAMDWNRRDPTEFARRQSAMQRTCEALYEACRASIAQEQGAEGGAG